MYTIMKNIVEVDISPLLLNEDGTLLKFDNIGEAEDYLDKLENPSNLLIYGGDIEDCVHKIVGNFTPNHSEGFTEKGFIKVFKIFPDINMVRFRNHLGNCYEVSDGVYTRVDFINALTRGLREEYSVFGDFHINPAMFHTPL